MKRIILRSLPDKTCNTPSVSITRKQSHDLETVAKAAGYTGWPLAKTF